MSGMDDARCIVALINSIKEMIKLTTWQRKNCIYAMCYQPIYNSLSSISTHALSAPFSFAALRSR